MSDAGAGKQLAVDGARTRVDAAVEGRLDGEARRARSFRIKVAIVWVVILIVLAVFFALTKFDWAWMRANFKFIAIGIWVTIFVSICSIFFATILALLGALGRLSKNSVAYGVTGFYISFFRGTPLIVQIFLIYGGVAQIGTTAVPRSFGQFLVFSPVVAGILALSLNYGAYMTEIFRAGIQAVGGSQIEAAEALGMTYWQRMHRVILPQAFRIIIPPTGNEFIAMMKDSALVSLVASAVFWYDIFKRANVIGYADFRNLEAFILAAALYWILTSIFTFFQRRLERRLSRGYVRTVISSAQPGVPLH